MSASTGRSLSQRAARPTRLPLWVPALTAGLLTIGFTPQRYAAPSPEAKAAREHGRGRLASTPSKIPARGWKDILLRVWKNIGEDRVILVAAGVTFYSLLAIFPAIAAVVALYGLFADPSSIAARLDSLSGVLPSGALDVIRQEINRIASQGQTTLGVAFVVGLAVSLWSSNAGIKSIFDALNLVYNEPEKRGLIRLNLVSLAFTVAAILFVLLAIGCIAALPALFSTSLLQGVTALIAQIVRWPVLLVIVALGLAFAYRFGPSRRETQWRWITWGSAFAAITWIAVSILFSWYAQNFGSYNKTYGSLGAVIAFMVWMWLSTVVILIGAELDAEMEHRTIRDTTVGQPKPIDARGATMADIVGAARTD
jgi:membrane protein